MVKVDFKNLVILDVEDKEQTVDISKKLGNWMYLNASSYAMAKLGKDIYKNGEVEVTEDMEKTVMKATKDAGFVFPIWMAVEKILKG